MKQYFYNARVVLPDQVLDRAAVLVEDGIIRAISPESGGDAQPVDLRGQWLLPGMVDLHCDAIEKEAEPRAKVMFPLDFACLQVDRRNAAAGITTPYHALSFANTEWGVRNNDTAAELVREVKRLQSQLLVDNRIHLRYEITDATALPIIMELLDEGSVDLLSIMDHTPGQGQFKHLDAYVAYMMGNHGSSREEALQNAQDKMAARQDADDRVFAIMERAKSLGIPTASHDDDDPQRVATMKGLGASMSEFPINLETARAAHQQGLPTILGAPNVMRGRSQSGSMRAVDAIVAGVADCLCADYAPATMLAALFTLLKQEVLPMHEAMKLVAGNPARAAGLHDRGEIVVGKRADLVAVTETGGLPMATGTWVAGRRAYAADYPQHG
ncbi:alpha-D-ribose 1-methylphosphonate 5-triphosphate diphosphatase [Uliginosibacterium sp. H1]|uniref:alpha-D-ribose 1-methylphosphonate 5-triphosphate diphosphatase n=1 Tax=Uliginosibacterium sp. H1 TaxID=3114757 RepID=UPI002E16C330|nr:alpha-D-ribose 1-methylphosphonate 5-triphosphate diphosphatase [Uliginosibacterium sp. H1]